MGQLDFILNGQPVCAAGFTPRSTLLDFIRQRGLTGAKEGCAEGECGACTVVLVKSQGEGSVYRPVNSCLMFLPMVAGQEVITVEALAPRDGPMAEVQRAIADGGGSQCGYCTPGFVMSLFAEQYRPDRNGPCDPHAMGGNLCRCTGYRPLRDAAMSVGPPPDGPLLQRLRLPPPPLTEVALPGFYRPTSLDECAQLLSTPDARMIAGGTDLTVESNLRGRRFTNLVSLEAIPELCRFNDGDDVVEIGAALTLTEIGERWADAPPIFREWLPLFASPLIRNRATLGGNLATASPIGDAAPLLLALDSEVRTNNRIVPLAQFFLGYRQTILQPAELITSIRIPKPFPHQARFFKAAKRRMDDISTVAAAFAFDFDSGRRISKARLAYGGVAAIPIRAVAAEDALLGQPQESIGQSQVQQLLRSTLKPISDHRGSARYRLALAGSLLEKFATEL